MGKLEENVQCDSIVVVVVSEHLDFLENTEYDQDWVTQMQKRRW